MILTEFTENRARQIETLCLSLGWCVGPAKKPLTSQIAQSSGATKLHGSTEHFTSPISNSSVSTESEATVLSGPQSRAASMQPSCISYDMAFMISSSRQSLCNY